MMISFANFFNWGQKIFNDLFWGCYFDVKCSGKNILWVVKKVSRTSLGFFAGFLQICSLHSRSHAKATQKQ